MATDKQPIGVKEVAAHLKTDPRSRIARPPTTPSTPLSERYSTARGSCAEARPTSASKSSVSFTVAAAPPPASLRRRGTLRGDLRT